LLSDKVIKNDCDLSMNSHANMNHRVLLRETTHRMVIRYHAELWHRYVPNLKVRVPFPEGKSSSDYHDLIKAFGDRTGYGVIMNTSFNVRGEPIDCTPFDAIACLMRKEMDVLVLGDRILYKGEQPDWTEKMGNLEVTRWSNARREWRGWLISLSPSSQKSIGPRSVSGVNGSAAVNDNGSELRGRCIANRECWFSMRLPAAWTRRPNAR